MVEEITWMPSSSSNIPDGSQNIEYANSENSRALTQEEFSMELYVIPLRVQGLCVLRNRASEELYQQQHITNILLN